MRSLVGTYDDDNNNNVGFAVLLNYMIDCNANTMDSFVPFDFRSR